MSFLSLSTRGPLPSGTPPATTALAGVVTSSDAAFVRASMDYFGSLRIPAMLIAGSSFAAIFSLLVPVLQSYKPSRNLSVMERIFLKSYHAIAFLSFLLSMTTVVTTSTAHTSLLLSKTVADASTVYADAYHFLKATMPLEFVLGRWSFFTSTLLFIASVGMRLILELQLLKPGNRLHACTVGFTLFAFFGTITAQINCTLNCWPSLLAMTGEVGQLIWQRALQKNPKSTMHLLSVFSFVGAVACVVYWLVDLLGGKSGSDLDSAPLSSLEGTV